MRNPPEDQLHLHLAIPKVTCRTPQKLAESKPVASFLEMMNGDRNGQPPVTPETLQSSFQDFERTRAYFEQYPVQGNARDIQRLMHLIDELGAQVKKVDTEHKLPDPEVRDRFKKLGIDIVRQAQVWEQFYRKADYKSALVEHGVLTKNEPYTLPLPALCEAEMQAFEKALALNGKMAVMVDDARLTPSETFGFFQRRFNKNSDAVTSVRLVQALPVSPQMVQRHAAQDDIDPAAALRELHGRMLEKYNENIPRGVRLVAYDPEARCAYWGMGNSEKGMLHGAEAMKDVVEFMDLGTFMRLCKYLEKQGGQALYNFQNYRDDREQGYIPLSTVTANVAPDGNVFAIDYSSSSKRFTVKKVDPSTADRHFGDIVREVVQTKI